MARLVVGKGKDKGKVIKLPSSGEVVIGRELSNQFPIRDAQASRRHCRLVIDDAGIRCENLKSVNGTWINEERSESSPVSVGDKIRVGETILFLVDDKNSDEGDLTGQELAGYKIGKLLGRGGMGSVYAAQQLSLDRMVAFKVLAKELASDEEFVSRFLEEARSAGRLNHQNIVQVYDVGQVGGTYFYSLELMDNGSVEDLLREKGQLDVATVLPIAIDAARGLQYAEKKGLIHRDIKPANLFLSKEDVTKIGDLGIAQRFASGATASQETVSGSPHYIAPEQALGKEIDQRVDLYSLGVSMFEMLTGEVPYSGRSPQEIIMKHINDPVPLLKEKRKDIPVALQNIVMALMEKEAEKRIASATQLISLLVPLLKDYPTRTTALIRLQADLSASSGRLGAANDSDNFSTDTADPILASLAAANQEAEGADRPSIWPKIVLGLGAVILMSCLCIGLFSTIAQSKAEYAQREAQIASLEEALTQSNSVTTKKEASTLATQWDSEGYPELAERASKLAEKAQVKIEETKKAEREQNAAKAYAILNGRMEKLAIISKDEEGLRSLDKDLTAFVEAYFDTVAADRARSDLIRVEKAIVRFKDEQKQRQEELAEFQRRSKACKASIEKKLKARRFSEAVDILSSYRERNPDPKYQAAARGFEQQLYAIADSMIKDIRTEIMGIAASGDYVKARRAIDDNEKLVGLARYASNFKSLRKSIDDIEKAAEAQAAEDLRKADLAVFEKAFDQHVKAAARARDFEKASQSLRSIVVSLNVPDIAKEVKQKALLYSLAQKAIGTLVEHINSKKMKSGVTRVFVHKNGEKLCIAVEAERFVILFAADKRVQYPCRLEKLRPIEILDFFKALTPTPKTELYLSSLAWALGETDFARSHSQKLTTFSETELEEGRLALRKLVN